MRWARLLLAAVLVIGWSSTAAAECAWVLWGLTTWRTGNYQWEALLARPTYKECRLSQRHFIKADAETKKAFKTDKQLEDFVDTRIETIERSGRGPVCLPDTIDPRERKD